MKYRKERGNVGSGEALQRARESGSGAIISVWLYPDAYAPGSETRRCTHNAGAKYEYEW
jgi:hypothetical protein